MGITGGVMKNLYKDWTAESYEREIDQLKRRLGIKEAENKILFREGKSLREENEKFIEALQYAEDTIRLWRQNKQIASAISDAWKSRAYLFWNYKMVDDEVGANWFPVQMAFPKYAEYFTEAAE